MPLLARILFDRMRDHIIAAALRPYFPRRAK
jgi:hypothetical protein